MKTLLLATTLLAASATLAHAQAVTITGEGRMGLMYTSGGAGWSTENRLTLNFNVAVQADHGLSFGAWTRARINSSGTSLVGPGPDGLPGTADDVVTRGGLFSGSRVWVEASGLRLTFGNVDGALATAGTSHGWLGGCMIGYEGGTLCGDAVGLYTVAHQEQSTSGQAAALTMVSYTAGNYTVAVSDLDGVSTEIGARATFGAVTVAAGFTTLGDVWTVSGHYTGGAWGVGAIVASNAVATNWALSGTANLGGGTLYAYVGREFGADAFGLSYGYGLGGGATLTVGGERVGATTVASVGVAFNF